MLWQNPEGASVFSCTSSSFPRIDKVGHKVGEIVEWYRYWTQNLIQFVWWPASADWGILLEKAGILKDVVCNSRTSIGFLSIMYTLHYVEIDMVTSFYAGWHKQFCLRLRCFRCAPEQFHERTRRFVLKVRSGIIWILILNSWQLQRKLRPEHCFAQRNLALPRLVMHLQFTCQKFQEKCHDKIVWHCDGLFEKQTNFFQHVTTLTKCVLFINPWTCGHAVYLIMIIPTAGPVGSNFLGLGLVSRFLVEPKNRNETGTLETWNHATLEPCLGCKPWLMVLLLFCSNIYIYIIYIYIYIYRCLECLRHDILNLRHRFFWSPFPDAMNNILFLLFSFQSVKITIVPGCLSCSGVTSPLLLHKFFRICLLYSLAIQTASSNRRWVKLASAVLCTLYFYRPFSNLSCHFLTLFQADVTRGFSAAVTPAPRLYSLHLTHLMLKVVLIHKKQITLAARPGPTGLIGHLHITSHAHHKRPRSLPELRARQGTVNHSTLN